MKFSFMSFSAPDASLGELTALAIAYGYDGLELRLDAGHAHGVETTMDAHRRRSVREKMAGTSISVCALATSCKFADPADKATQVDEAKRCVDLAADLSVPVIRVFGGKVPLGVIRSQAFSSIVEALHELGDHAADSGVTVCLETHDDWRDPSFVARLLEEAASPNAAVNWDVMHPVLAGYTIDEAFAALQPWIRHVHVHDAPFGPGQLAPIGEGRVDHGRVMELLHSMGYEGYVSGEWINWGPHDKYLGRELATLKRLAAEAANR